MRGLLLALVATGAWAQDDFVVTDGKLSAQAFYDLVSCGAPPGGPCVFDRVRWAPEDALDLVVGFAPVQPGYPRVAMRPMSDALDAAIAEINGAGAALRLRRAGKQEGADVTIHLAAIGEGDAIAGTGVAGVDGEIIGAALVTVWWDDALNMTDAVIVVAGDLPEEEMRPVLLEEVTQALGLLTDVRNPFYEDLSVFSEDSNRVTKLGVQDREALRRHYGDARGTGP